MGAVEGALRTLLHTAAPPTTRTPRLAPTFRRAVLLLLILALTLPLTLAAAGCNRIDKATVIKKVSATFRRLEDYSGVAVKTISVSTFDETMEVNQWFRKPDLHRIEIVSPPEVKGQTTVYDGDTLYFYSPSDKEVMAFTDPSPELTKGDRADLATSFAEIVMTSENLRVVGQEKLADRSTVVIEARSDEKTGKAAKKGSATPTTPATSSGDGAPGKPAATPSPSAAATAPMGIVARQRIWIDTTIWFPLKVESYDQNGKLVASILYKEVRLNTGISEDTFHFVPPAGVRVVRADWSIAETTLADAQQMVAFSLLQPSYRPSGLSLRSVNRSGSTDTVSIIFEYTNGKGVSVTLTESALQPDAPSLAGTRRTDYNGRTYEVIQSEDYSILNWSATGVAFNLTGNLSLEEMRKVADSVR